MEDIIDQLRVVTVPKGTQLHLWDMRKGEILKPHFVSSGEIHVLVRKDYGPVYSLLRKYLMSTDFLMMIKEFMSDLKDMYYRRNPQRLHNTISSLKEELGHLEDVDALLMAETLDGKAALFYIHEGEKPNLSLMK